MSLREQASWRVLDGFGSAVRTASRTIAPTSVDDLAATMARARAEGLPMTFRGAGRSYGDAALSSHALVVDTQAIARVLAWDPATGIIDCEPGVTIEQLWKHTLEDGYWPAVVPGTMRPTMAGCVAMNIHGKNNFRVGPFGEHVLEVELLLPSGERMLVAKDRQPDVFHAVLGGMGLLGAVTRVRLKLKRVESGRLRVEALVARSLGEMFDIFEARVASQDYLVGWIDCFARGSGLGRGQVHAASYLSAADDPDGKSWLSVAKQGLPSHLAGVPKNQLWRFMRLFANDPAWAMVGRAKYLSSRLQDGKTYLQSHVAFAFLLDYVPDWWLAYGQSGLIQYQVFVPDATARAAMTDVLSMCQDATMVPYLGVFKRHRPDAFLLSHALDGWSMALDFRVPPGGRDELWALTHRLTERVLAAGGKFYFAKDAVLDAGEAERAYGKARLDAFRAMKRRLDPEGLLTSDLWERINDNAGAARSLG